ncbi:YhgE/Pip family protein [Metabacillus fastidiosus]|uniref:YhgE/Pip family protein n=1 Tax=Metabacillus fastidiosus TaxID=1458 RepID=UPI003D2B4F3E
MSLLKTEWKNIFKNKKLLIAIIGVMFIPLLYSGVYLYAFWDPYGNLDRLPVAVVNEDTGTQFEGKNLQVGSDLIENLKEEKKFNWQFVNKAEAEKGLENEEYYMIIEIPKEFSKNAASLTEDNPKKLEIKYIPNEGMNFLSSQIGENAVVRIKDEVSKTLTKTYAESIFENIEKLADGIGKASDGSSEINNGAIDLKEGSGKLKDNLEKLAESSITFEDGLKTASSGSEKLTKGLKALDEGLGKMQEGQKQLANGAEKAENGAGQLKEGLSTSLAGMKEMQNKVPQLTDGTSTLAKKAPEIVTGTKKLAEGNHNASEGAKQLSAGLDQVSTKLNASIEELKALPLPEEKKQELIALAAGIDQIKESSKNLSAGLDELDKGASTLNKGVEKLPEQATALNNGANALAKGVNELTAGQEKLYKGAGDLQSGQKQLTEGLTTFGEKITEAKAGSAQLVNGGNDLTSGVKQLADGSATLKDGSTKLADGSKELDDGVSKLSEGTEELSTKLQGAREESKDAKGSDKLYDMVAEPVKVKDEKVNEVPNYGTGFAPYFISISLFVGALTLSIIFPMRDSFGTPKSGFSWFLSKFGVLFIVGIVQAVLVDSILLFILKIDVQNIPLFYLLSIITSFTFLSIVQFLVTTMDNPGRFIGIIILILQLTTSAGSFPLELIPTALQPIHNLLPMSYSVSGFKAVITSGDYAHMWNQAFILIGYMVVMMIGTIAYFTMKVRKNRIEEVQA